MRVYFLTLILILVLKPALAQKKNYPPPPPPPSEPKRTSVSKYDLKKRLAFYPFNRSTQVKLAYFEPAIIEGPAGDSVEVYQLPVDADSVCLSKLKVIKPLTLQQVDTLTDILFNECFRWNIGYSYMNSCYRPRNAILFFDESGKSFEYIEICFECVRLQLSNQKARQPGRCEYMYEYLESFFNRCGVKTTAEK